MRLNYLFALASIILSSCSSSNKPIVPWNDDLSTEQNIAKNAIALETNDDFSFLDNIVSSRSIFICGEEGHSDFMTSETKIKMINYLQSKGFNSVAFEGSTFITSYVFFNPKYAGLTENWDSKMILSFSSIMPDDKAYHSFVEAIREHKIRFWGIDCYSGYYDIDAVKAILDEYSNLGFLPISWNKLKELYHRKFIPNLSYLHKNQTKLSITEQYELMRMIDTISNYTQYIMFSKGTTMDLKVIMQWIRNLNTSFSHIESLDTREAMIGNEAKWVLEARNRDIQMAENIDWIVKNVPEEKIIVWCANFHGAKDISQSRYPTDSLLYFAYQTLGEFVTAAHGDKVYSLAFTSLRNQNDRGKLEMEIANTTDNAPFAFVDFVPLRFSDGYRDKAFENNVIMKKQGKWLYMFDGLYYIRDQKKGEEVNFGGRVQLENF